MRTKQGQQIPDDEMPATGTLASLFGGHLADLRFNRREWREREEDLLRTHSNREEKTINQRKMIMYEALVE